MWWLAMIRHFKSKLSWRIAAFDGSLAITVSKLPCTARK